MSTLTSRIHRGFHRIGVVLALPVLLVAGALAGHEAWLQWASQFPWVADPIIGHDAPTFLERFNTAAYHANFVVPMLLAALSVPLYAAARAVGWVLDGFLSPRA